MLARGDHNADCWPRLGRLRSTWQTNCLGCTSPRNFRFNIYAYNTPSGHLSLEEIARLSLAKSRSTLKNIPVPHHDEGNRKLDRSRGRSNGSRNVPGAIPNGRLHKAWTEKSSCISGGSIGLDYAARS